MKVTSASSVFSIILNHISHKYVISSKASEVRKYIICFIHRFYKIILRNQNKVYNE